MLPLKKLGSEKAKARHKSRPGGSAPTLASWAFFLAKYFIDCTGDGQLAYKAGASYSVGSDEEGYSSSPTLMFRVANCDVEQLMTCMEEHPKSGNS